MLPIYHITHLNNLPSIVNGGVCCDNIEIAQRLSTVNIAHENIKERRRRRLVMIGPHGTLADYAPFYFAPRSPMLYVIHKGGVDGYTDGQNPIVHLVVYIEDIVEQDFAFVFTDGHAEMAVSGQFTDLADLQKIDWPLLKSTYWNDTNEYPNRTQRRQAEFLVHERCPWDLVKEIGVINSESEQRIATILDQLPRPQITIHRDWYY
jgi:hypothetical protein